MNLGGLFINVDSCHVLVVDELIDVVPLDRLKKLVLSYKHKSMYGNIRYQRRDFSKAKLLIFFRNV